MRDLGDPALQPSAFRRFGVNCSYCWSQVRALWQGLKLAKASVISLIFGFLMFAAVPQAQDLFLEVRGSFVNGTLYWILFYLAVMVGWALPTYISSRWILDRFAEDPGAARSDAVAIPEWVRQALPPVLAALCFVAVLVGQAMSLRNAPTVQAAAAADGSSAEQCLTRNMTCSPIETAQAVAAVLSRWITQGVGQEWPPIIMVVLLSVIALWLPLRSMIAGMTRKGWRITASIFWWLLTCLVLLPATVVIGALYLEAAKMEYGRTLNVSHLFILPLATLIVVWVTWWGLRWRRDGRPTHFAQGLMLLSGGGKAVKQIDATRRLLAPLFFVALQISLAIFAVLLITEPAQLTGHLYRALLLPFLLGMFVAPFTYFAYWSTRARAPLITICVLVFALASALLPDTHDVRTEAAPAHTFRPNMLETVSRWTAVNGCKLNFITPGRYGPSNCPRPIIVAAAGGASRAAFLNGAVIGKLLDDEQLTAVPVGHDDVVSDAVFSPDGRSILTSSAWSARLWDIDTGDEKVSFEGHSSELISKVLSTDGRLLLTVAQDKSARLWNAQNGFTITTIRNEFDRTVTGAEFNAGQSLIVVSFSDSTSQIWDVATGRRLVEIKGGGISRFSPDSTRVVTTSPIRVWDVATGEPLSGRLSPSRGESLTFSPDGKFFALSMQRQSRGQSYAAVWKVGVTEPVATILGESRRPMTIDFSADSRRFLTLDAGEGTAKLFDVTTQQELAILAPVGNGVKTSRAQFSPNGRWVLTENDDMTVQIWDAELGRQTALIADLPSARFSPDSANVMAVAWPEIRIFSALTGEKVRSFKADSYVAAYDATGERIVSHDLAKVYIWNAATGEQITNFQTQANKLKRYRPIERKLRPLGKQLFAISAVSGGALSAIVTYGALADSQTKERATNGLGNPPCVEAGSDTQWFAPYVNPEELKKSRAQASSSRWKPHESWRGCLELILSGDFLSPVAVSLFSTDLLQLPWRGDRAATLEKAWELRYAQMTGQDTAKSGQLQPVSTLGRSIIETRRSVLEASTSNWLPLLVLNGTSVSTGRRIITSDVSLTTTVDQKSRRLLIDTYDLHQMIGSDRDIRLSTGATMSARFPIISPHGTLRRKDGPTEDRVVDGAYYENFGAISALELVGVLRRYGLDPFVIVVNNDPALGDLDCISSIERNVDSTKSESIITLATVASPLKALLATGSGRASLAAAQTCREMGENFAFISVSPDAGDPGKALSMSWWLSMHVQKYLDNQLADKINKVAFRVIADVRADNRQPTAAQAPPTTAAPEAPPPSATTPVQMP